MDIIWLLIKRSWVGAAIATLAGLISGSCSALLIALINEAITQQGSPQSLALPFTGLALLMLVTGAISQFLLIDLAQDSVYRLRMQMSDHILSAPFQQLEQLGPSQLLATLTKDVQAISDTVFAIPFLCIDIAVLAGCLIYMSILSGRAFTVVMAFLIIAIAIIQLFVNYAYRYIALARKEVDSLFKHFRSLTDGAKELKLNTQRRHLFIEKDLQPSATFSRNYTKTAFKFASVSNNIGSLLFFILTGILLFLGPQLISEIQAVLSAYILTMTYILGPIEGIIQRIPNLLNANVSIQKVTEMGLILADQAERPSVTHRINNTTQYTLTLNQVTHTYHSNHAEHPFTLGPLDLTLTSGEITFIVGGNGSGKSTLAKLITGLYLPDTGTIQLNTQTITDTNCEWYRQHFSAIFSDFHLFTRLLSAGANPHPQPIEAQAKNYLHTLQLDNKVSINNNQLSTLDLSQGQRKRLALLSAYLEARPIYLFDEWAADQDPIFRKIFYTKILPELKAQGKLIIAISHDDRYFHLADRIVKLDYGRIVP